MGGVATWVLFPSLGLTMIAGLLAIAVTPAFHNAGWAFAKLASGILVFEWTILGPMQEDAELRTECPRLGLSGRPRPPSRHRWVPNGIRCG